jgi:hypothetical protein
MISGTVKHELEHFDRTMGQYIALSRRTPAEVVAQKGAQIIMGNQSPPFPGLYQGLRRLAPKESEITRERLGVLSGTPRGAKRPVKVRRRARERADDLLAGRPSGLFQIRVRNGGRFTVRQTRFRKKGDKRIINRTNRGGTVRISRRADAMGSEKLLNRISLAIALELQMREQGRGYTAISFLPKKYRRMLGKARAHVRRNAQAYRNRKISMNKALTEGVGAMQEDVVLRNATGEVLGRVAFRSSGPGAALRITGFTPPQARAQAQTIVGDVLRSVSADTAVYIDRKLSRTRKEVGPFGK